MDNRVVEKEEEEDEGGDWRNHLKRMMDEIKKVQDLPKVMQGLEEPPQENDG